MATPLQPINLNIKTPHTLKEENAWKDLERLSRLVDSLRRANKVAMNKDGPHRIQQTPVVKTNRDAQLDTRENSYQTPTQGSPLSTARESAGTAARTPPPSQKELRGHSYERKHGSSRTLAEYITMKRQEH